MVISANVKSLKKKSKCHVNIFKGKIEIEIGIGIVIVIAIMVTISITIIQTNSTEIIKGQARPSLGMPSPLTNIKMIVD